MNPTVYYFIKSWKLIILLFNIIPILIALLGFVLVIENTPIELIAYSNP
jgi:hypothetical protein